MATVTTTIAPTLKLFPFTGFTEPYAERTSAARAEVLASARNQVVAAAGAGDNQEVSVVIDLPVNFAYALVDYCLSINNSAAGATYNFARNGSLFLFDTTGAAGRTLDVPIGLEGVEAVNDEDKPQVFYRPFNVWKGIVQAAAPGSQVRAIAELFNTTAADGAYAVDISARFIQYDVTQRHNFAVNSPQLVR